MPDDLVTPPVVADPVDPSGKKPEVTPADSAKDTVKYESYAKLLDEKKKLQAKYDEIAKAQADAEESKRKAHEEELKAKDDWKKLVTLREQELERVKQEKAKLEADLKEQGSRRANALKMRSFLDTLTGKLDEQYWSLVDLDKIVMNPETGMPEPTSIQALAQEFETKYPLVLQRADSAKLPNDAAKGGGAPMTFAAEIRTAKTQKEYDAIMAKHGKI